MEDMSNKMTLGFKSEGDIIYLIGRSRNDISSYEYLYSYHRVKASSSPYFDLDEEYAIQNAVSELIKNRLIVSAHDVSEGGLFVTLAESAMANNKGFDVTSESGIRKDAWLFGESQSRVVVSTNNAGIEEFLSNKNIPFRKIGKTTSENFVVDGVELLESSKAKGLYSNALGAILGQ